MNLLLIVPNKNNLRWAIISEINNESIINSKFTLELIFLLFGKDNNSLSLYGRIERETKTSNGI